MLGEVQKTDDVITAAKHYDCQMCYARKRPEAQALQALASRLSSSMNESRLIHAGFNVKILQFLNENLRLEHQLPEERRVR